MWILVAILIAIVLYLIVLASGKADELQSEIDEVDDEIEKLSRNYQEQIQTATHNNVVLIEKNKELQNFRTDVENIIYGKRTAEEKIEKIELLLSGKNSNQN
mgnify:CR=1 FL=1